MTPAVTAVVVGHWSQDGSLHTQHITGEHHNFLHVTSQKEAWRGIINWFSYRGQTVLVVIDGSEPGWYMVDILQHVRTYIHVCVCVCMCV